MSDEIYPQGISDDELHSRLRLALIKAERERDEALVAREKWMARADDFERERDEAQAESAKGWAVANTMRDHAITVERERDEAREALARMRNVIMDCAEVDACMDGPKFKGWNLSDLRRAADAIRAAIAKGE